MGEVIPSDKDSICDLTSDTSIVKPGSGWIVSRRWLSSVRLLFNTLMLTILPDEGRLVWVLLSCVFVFFVIDFGSFKLVQPTTNAIKKVKIIVFNFCPQFYFPLIKSSDEYCYPRRLEVALKSSLREKSSDLDELDVRFGRFALIRNRVSAVSCTGLGSFLWIAWKRH